MTGYRLEKAMRFYLTFMLICGALLFALIISMGAENSHKEKELSAKKALLQSLGITSLSLSDDCTGTKNILSDLCGCLSDIPGGYCYHDDCNYVAAPDLNTERGSGK
ncbi:MAG: hypothetical protein ACM3WV_06040 [Bacillota bacterium]